MSYTPVKAAEPSPFLDMCFRHWSACPSAHSKGGCPGRFWDSVWKKVYKIDCCWCLSKINDCCISTLQASVLVQSHGQLLLCTLHSKLAHNSRAKHYSNPTSQDCILILLYRVQNGTRGDEHACALNTREKGVCRQKVKFKKITRLLYLTKS